jgi:hypothetical protein
MLAKLLDYATACSARTTVIFALILCSLRTSKPASLKTVQCGRCKSPRRLPLQWQTGQQFVILPCHQPHLTGCQSHDTLVFGLKAKNILITTCPGPGAEPTPNVRG